MKRQTPEAHGHSPDRRQILIGGSAILTLPVTVSSVFAQGGARPEELAKPRPEYIEARAAILKGREPTVSRVRLDIPRISESGNSVPFRVIVDSPMTEEDHVRTIHVLSEQNPFALIARFHFRPGDLRPDVQTRIRLATTQRVHALVEMSDGSLHEGAAETVVALAACLD